MSEQEKPFYKSFTFLGLIAIAASWIIIYGVWVTYPDRIMNDDKYNSKNLPENTWKGVPYQIPTEEEMAGRSYYGALGEKYGTYGDMYGSLNTLFSGLAFATLIISLFLQMLELRETRKELASQSQALKDQKTEFENQTQILQEQEKNAKTQLDIVNNQLIESKKQNFNNLFNALLEERRFRINNMIILPQSPGGESITKDQVFVSYANNFLSKIDGKNITLESILEKFGVKNNFNNRREQLYQHWIKFEHYETRNYVIGNYFNTFINLLDSIEEYKDILDRSYESHINIIKSLFTIHEIIVFFWVALIFDKYDKYVHKYKLLDKLPYTKGCEILAKSTYKIQAFGNNPDWIAAYKENDS